MALTTFSVRAQDTLPKPDYELKEAVVQTKKARYSRKNNPAVELMKKVIDAAHKGKLRENHDFVANERYSKLTLMFDEVTEKVFQEGKYKNFPFLKDHVEVCNETGTLTLPFAVDEDVTREIWRRGTDTEKEIVLGRKTTSFSDLFNTGELVNTLMQDIFTKVDILDNDIRLFRNHFSSPIATDAAIGFYRYFIQDTLMMDSVKCIEIAFTPNNPQDFGFTGRLFVAADSTYRITRVSMGLPVKSGVDWVDRLFVEQKFQLLPTGENVMTHDKTIVQLKIINKLPKMLAKRVTEYRDFNFSPIDDKEFSHKTRTYVKPDALMQSKEFWDAHRSEKLTEGESKIKAFMDNLMTIKWFKPVLWVVKAFVENSIETTLEPGKQSYVEITPVNTTISSNFIDGCRLRLSGQTTARLHPHLFLRGYVAYGFKDKRWKGQGEVTWSFNKKNYLPREFPVRNLTFIYQNDVMSSADKFLPTDKDNVFTSLRWSKVERMMYAENFRLSYDHEWENNVRLKTQLKYEKNDPTGELFYVPVTEDPTSEGISRIRTAEIMMNLTWQPGAEWMNTKQRRKLVNKESPLFGIMHTTGIKGIFGSDYNYNFTELTFRKRIFMRSWGSIDVAAKGGVQWNKVPFPLLIAPAANLSYIVHDNTFRLINNMEFLNDRYASLMLGWDLNGKLFNRIPLLKRLKWREFLGVNVLWGDLSNKNNPYLVENQGDEMLMWFPGENGENAIMNPKKPYVEVIAGIHNIFNILHVEYVQRLNYLSYGAQRWGIRCKLQISF